MRVFPLKVPVVCAAAAFASLALSGCAGVGVNKTPTGPEEHETRSVELDKAELVHAQVKMKAGEIDVHEGSEKLMDAEFTYNVAGWKPEITYKSSNGEGDLVIRQPGPDGSTGNAKNNWDLRFNEKVPLDLTVEFGAGEARLNLGKLNLRGVDFQMGAGKVRLDLRGAPTHDYSVKMQGGVGEATVYLPKDAAISADVQGGLGEVTATGLRKSGGHYENDAPPAAKAKIRLDIQGGVGAIKLIAE